MPAPIRTRFSTVAATVRARLPSTQRVRERPVDSTDSARPASSSARIRRTEETVKAVAMPASSSSE